MCKTTDFIRVHFSTSHLLCLLPITCPRFEHILLRLDLGGPYGRADSVCERKEQAAKGDKVKEEGDAAKGSVLGLVALDECLLVEPFELELPGVPFGSTVVACTKRRVNVSKLDF